MRGWEPRVIKIRDDLSIPEAELTVTASRSSGPGGQHVNKVSTRVTVRFDVIRAAALTAEQKSLVLNRLPTRINKEGVLWVVSQRERSQSANREAAVARLVEMIRSALTPRVPRKATRPSRAGREARLGEKKQRSCLKRERSKVDDG